MAGFIVVVSHHMILLIVDTKGEGKIHMWGFTKTIFLDKGWGWHEVVSGDGINLHLQLKLPCPQGTMGWFQDNWSNVDERLDTQNRTLTFHFWCLMSYSPAAVSSAVIAFFAVICLLSHLFFFFWLASSSYELFWGSSQFSEFLWNHWRLLLYTPSIFTAVFCSLFSPSPPPLRYYLSTLDPKELEKKKHFWRSGVGCERGVFGLSSSLSKCRTEC